MQEMGRGKSQMFDRYGYYGEEGSVYDLKVRHIRHERGVHEITTILPDGREIMEYAGRDGSQAALIFKLLLGARVPESIREGR